MNAREQYREFYRAARIQLVGGYQAKWHENVASLCFGHGWRADIAENAMKSALQSDRHRERLLETLDDIPF